MGVSRADWSWISSHIRDICSHRVWIENVHHAIRPRLYRRRLGNCFVGGKFCQLHDWHDYELFWRHDGCECQRRWRVWHLRRLEYQPYWVSRSNWPYWTNGSYRTDRANRANWPDRPRWSNWPNRRNWGNGTGWRNRRDWPGRSNWRNGTGRCSYGWNNNSCWRNDDARSLR